MAPACTQFTPCRIWKSPRLALTPIYRMVCLLALRVIEVQNVRKS